MTVALVWATSALVAVGTSVASPRDGDPPPDTVARSESHDARCGGEPCAAVARGFLHFFDRTPDGQGNGRSCNDCHMVTDHFQLSPANAERRFQILQKRREHNKNADDPLFRPIDADDFRTSGEAARDFRNLRENGLIRIEFALPANIKLIDPVTNQPSAETSVDVWRSVPTVNDVKLTGADGQNPWTIGPNPLNPTGGYQLDGRFATLQEQAAGALKAHAQVQLAVPQQFLDDLHSFQRVLFTNHRVRALSDAIDDGVEPLPDPDPPLSALEKQGKVVFARACAQCHGSPTQSLTPVGIVRFHDILSQCPRPPAFGFAPCPPRLARNARTYEITFTGGPLTGMKTRRVSSDPGRALMTGFVGGPTASPGPSPFDDWGKFDMPALRGISKTAPYFHNNSADTLEAVVDHYIALFKLIEAAVRPPGVPAPPVASTDGVHFDRIPTPEERPALLAYLKKL